MEGTRNEKAVLVVLSYFIGGITAFIWYSQHSLPQLQDITILNNQSANVISATTEPTNTVSRNNSLVKYHDGMLEVSILGNSKILSFQAEQTGVTDPNFADQGTHVGDLMYSVSPSQEFVFFCEKKTALAGTCLPFVYDVLTDTIYPVRRNGERVEILNSAASATSWMQNFLKIDTETSKDASKPWLLGF